MTVISSVDVTTQACQSDLDNIANADALGLPRFSGDEGDTQQLNLMAQQLEGMINETVLKDSKCQICPVDGAVILDCQQCDDFMIMGTEDINSITMLNCDSGDGTVDIYVPPNTTRCLCGWPETFGFEGGECFTGCVTTGSSPAGRVYSFPYQGTNRGPQAKPPGGGGVPTTGGGGGACACSPSTPGTLTIVCCTTCNMSCSPTGAGGSVALRACGGVPPYFWSTTGGFLHISDPPKNSQADLDSPANPGSAVAGTAYAKRWGQVSWVTCVQSFDGLSLLARANYGCNDNFIDCSGTDPCPGDAMTTPCTGPNTGMQDCGNEHCGLHQCICDPAAAEFCNQAKSTGSACDTRTQGMIDAGCVPCGLMNNTVVTVTDSTGISASKTIAA